MRWFGGLGGGGTPEQIAAQEAAVAAFNYFQVGYASTLAWGMFIVALLITLVLFGTAKHRVFYAGGEG